MIPPCVPMQCLEFRQSLRKPSNAYNIKAKSIRIVPAFTVQSRQRNTKVLGPPKTDVYKEIKLERNEFTKLHKRGDLPVMIGFTSSVRKLLWKVQEYEPEIFVYILIGLPIQKIDMNYYFPLFLYGLCDNGYPYDFIVERGINDLIRNGSRKILSCVPDIIAPLKAAYLTKKPDIICTTNRCVVNLVSTCDHVGEALVPYYRHLLPALTLLLKKPRESKTDNVLVRKADIWFSIEDTLNILERYGGPDAFLNIKYYVPEYESCVSN